MKAVKKWISTALGLMLAGASAPALAQNTSANQATADAVAGALSDNAGLSASRIKIESRDGQVTLSGVVPAPELKTEALQRASRVAGVSQVVDRLTVGDPRIVPVRYPVEADPARVAMGGGPFNQTLDNVGTLIEWTRRHDGQRSADHARSELRRHDGREWVEWAEWME